MACTVVFYLISTPDTIAVKRHAPGTVRAPYWGGTVDSDFDWCEENHAYLTDVAEPFNTFFTSCAYPLGATLAYQAHKPLGLSGWHKALLLVTLVMGLGSMIFHGTLRYSAQLLDELPLFTMSVLAASSLHARARCADWLQPAIAGWALALAAVLLASDRDSSTHHALRAIMSVSFAVACVYVFTVSAVVASEIDRRRGGTDGAHLFRASFVAFVAALCSWLLDVAACQQLRHLPLSMPYPQLHAIGWHLGTCFGLLHLFAMMLLHERSMRDGTPTLVRWNALGIPSVHPAYAKALRVLRGSRWRRAGRRMRCFRSCVVTAATYAR
jgi:dihydroceramidase